jgi:hypothetical protein
MVNPLSRRCHEQGPALEPDDAGYAFHCTRPFGHPGAHRAELAGRVLDTWPRASDYEGSPSQPGQ